MTGIFMQTEIPGRPKNFDGIIMYQEQFVCFITNEKFLSQLLQVTKLMNRIKAFIPKWKKF